MCHRWQEAFSEEPKAKGQEFHSPGGLDCKGHKGGAALDGMAGKWCQRVAQSRSSPHLRLKQAPAGMRFLEGVQKWGCGAGEGNRYALW